MNPVSPVKRRQLALGALLTLMAVFLAACGGSSGSGLTGDVKIDGSSTVFPISEAVSEEFLRENGRVRVTVGVSGTGGGFERFCAGETDITDASRPIKPAEAERCEAAGVEFVEIPVAYDGLSIVVHPDNDWVTCITIEELNKIWSPESEGSISKWSQINPDWPDDSIRLYGPGTDSGTFDYFTEVVNGHAGASRADYTASENDNVLVQGIAGDKYSLGYFGLAYLEENPGTIVGLGVDSGSGCVAPSAATVESGEYAPLSRPLFIYVKVESAEQPQVKAFVDFYLENAAFLAADVGYVKFPDEIYAAIRARWTALVTGSIFSGASGSVEDILRAD